uniref:uncharacterized protein LOC120330069 n=1 Tax=Styela clava TaxID=7725 RepID=UPI001939D9CF|nr:uncharacterized protein LOC120330069 [Styela clava]
MLIFENSRYILLLMLVQSFEFIQTKQCNIPEDNEDIDWDKLHDDWYDGLTDDAGMTTDFLGGKLENFTKTSTGVQYVIIELNKNSPARTTSLHMTKQRAGVYRPEKSEEAAVLALEALKPDGSINEKAMKIDEALFGGDILILSDEKNYMIHAFCSLEDEWVVWATFPTLNPTIQQISLMWNKLIEKGIIVQLYPYETVGHP